MARSINDLAAKHNTTARVVRKHIRAFERANERGDALPGKGKRYVLDARTYARFDKMLASKITAKDTEAVEA